MNDSSANPFSFPFVDLLADISKEWDAAELVIKRAEQISFYANIPAINELRYTGRRIVDALNRGLSSGDPENACALLIDARSDCYRARYDSMDAAAAFMAQNLDASINQLGLGNVIAAHPDFGDLYRDAMAMRNRLTETRPNRSNLDEFNLPLLEFDFFRLADRYADWRISEPVAMAFRVQQQRRRVGWWLMFAVTVLSIAIAIAK